MNKVLIVVIFSALILAAGIYFARTQEHETESDQAPTPLQTTVTPSDTQTPEDDKTVWDMFVEEVGEGRVEFMNSRLLMVNEGHVVQTVYITDDTKITGEDITIENLDMLEVGTPVRIIGSPSEGGVLAEELIINPEDHSPTRLVPEL